MASVDRAMAKAAAALLPGLLPTPPVAPCLIILPSSFASRPKPCRADSVERWDAHKKPRSPSSSSSCGSSSPGRASSCERWDVNKKIPSSSGGNKTSSSSSSSSRGSSTSSCEKWDRNKRSPSRRWDTHKKKASSAQADAQSRADEQDIRDKQPLVDPAAFSGSSLFASPEPSMLSMPIATFFRSRGHDMMPVPAH